MPKGPHSFDSALQTANVWLKAVDDRLLCDDRQTAYEALRAVLHVLRDRLPLEAVLGLSAQSPMLIRGLLLESWRPQDGPSGIRNPVAFCDAVAGQLPPSFPFSGLEAAEAVFAVLAERLDAGEVRKILVHLPEPLRGLWPGSRPVGAAADSPSHRPAPSREARRRTRVRWSLLVSAALTVAGGVLVWALIVGPVWSGAIDPASILLDPALGLQRLAAGLLFVGIAMLLGSTLAAFLIARASRS
ncbi:MAG: DUF2267 domain-containing protein [Brevundimonas sp.]|uniref:DUF2267 domain-containing protein n=1 Tax=Brevundimonas sp. TaxID=1871086 RepID=UPI002486E2F3|nr:DUF2267 domain-containing protein [Brevundimonas sp.]MDI1327729.1 DUF2267 domain-containing protein [Brevundimonas sp.]